MLAQRRCRCAFEPINGNRMNTAVKARTASKSVVKERQDLRAWIDQLRAAGELTDVKGAERECEIGGIVDIYQSRIGNKAVLFDDVPGYPRGHRILANILTSVRRVNITLGLRPDTSATDLVLYWRRYMKEAHAIAPVTVQTGPLLQNVRTGADIDIFKIPVPRWHEHDGGYYRDRRHGRHARSRYRLDQLRRLSRASAVAQCRDGHVLKGQARRSDPPPLS